MRWRLIGLFVGQLAVFSTGLLLTRQFVPIDEHPFIHISGVILSGVAAIASGLSIARRMDL